MDASLTTIQGLEHHLKLTLPSEPVWAISTSQLEGFLKFRYPTSKSSFRPTIELCAKEILDSALLNELANDPKTGFFPPYTFALVSAQEPFKDRKHVDVKQPWSRPEWAWAPEFSCRRYMPKKSGYHAVSLRIDDPLKIKNSKSKTTTMLMQLLKIRRALDSLKDSLWIEWQNLAVKNADSYQNFLKYCGLAYILHLNKQRQKVENQMVDAYEAWTKSYPGGVK